MTQYCLSELFGFDAILRRARRVLIASDFDGTLCPIAPSPSEVCVAPYMFEVLRLLSRSTRVELAVISGRTLEDVVKRLPVDAIFAGNHGLEIEGRGLGFQHDSAGLLRPELQSAIRDLDEVLRPWPGAWVEDKGLSATVHYRAVDQDSHFELRRAVRRCAIARNKFLGLRSATRALEIYPKVGWTKGDALEYIKEKAGPFDACVCLGDDQTDESMFSGCEGQINIKVGPRRPTRARFHLSEPSGVAVFLQHVSDVCEFSTDTAAAASPC